MIRFVLILLFCCLSAPAKGDQFTVNSIVRVYLSDETLVEEIISVSEIHQLNPVIFAAILAQESGFRVDAVNKQSRDYGIGQINILNIRSLKLDQSRLLKDRQYALNESGKLLARIRKTYGKEKFWFCRYNVGYGTLSGNRLKRCRAYAAKVSSRVPKVVARAE